MFSSEAIPVWTALASIATALMVAVTSLYTYYTFRLWRSQAEPKVIVYVKHDSERPTLLCLVIENIGRDIARDVRFTWSRPVPSEAFGLPGGPAAPPKVMTAGPLVTGIPSLGPGDCRVITWGQYGGLSAALSDGPPLVLSYTYRHERRSIQGSAVLEVASFADTDASEKPAAAIAKHAQKSAEELRHISATLATIGRRLSEQSRKEEERDLEKRADPAA